MDQGVSSLGQLNMNILVTGASGFIGSALVSRLRSTGHRVVPLRRAPAASKTGPTWNPDAGQIQLEPASSLEAVVHLAGENIAQRWTCAAKARIHASRVDATRLLCEALAQLSQPPRILVCASATGFYGDRADEMLDEQSGPGTGFLAELCQAWESTAAAALQHGIRVVHLRFGLHLVACRRGRLAADRSFELLVTSITRCAGREFARCRFATRPPTRPNSPNAPRDRKGNWREGRGLEPPL
ncbi:MAG: NAD-dependent epimerase/dehydratase family protein [Limisphaerales bacterium]